MDELTKLIEGQKPGEFDLSKEIATADAFSAYVAHLLRAGEAAVETFVKMQGTARELNQLLKRPPQNSGRSPPVRAASRTPPRGRTSSRTTRSSPISMRRRPRPLRCIKMMSRPTSTATSLITLKNQNMFMERLLTMLNQRARLKGPPGVCPVQEHPPGTHQQA